MLLGKRKDRVLYRHKKTDGFSLIELLVVIAIIGILGGMAVVYFRDSKKRVRVVIARVAISDIKGAMIRMETYTGEWPGHQIPWQMCPPSLCGDNEVWDLNSESAGLTQNDPGNPFSGWQGPYLDSVPLDPWGKPYFLDTDYRVQAGTDNPCGVPQKFPCDLVAAIGSFGPNRYGPNRYDDDDIIFVLAGKRDWTD